MRTRVILHLGCDLAIPMFAIGTFAFAAPMQTSSELVKEDPKAQYYVVKRAMQQLYDTGGVQSKVRPDEDSYDVYLCEEGSEYVGEFTDSQDRVRDLATLAVDIVIWRSDLRKLGYPEAVWRPTLVEFENTQLDLLLKERERRSTEENPPSRKNFEATTKRLAAVLNDYRQKASPSLMRVVSQGGCGAGEFGVKISAEPGNGRVFFIPVFFHELCSAQRLDPDDMSRCNRWHEAVDGQLAYVAGDYYYFARWPDGAVRTGRLSFKNLQDGQSIVFRKP